MNQMGRMIAKDCSTNHCIEKQGPAIGIKNASGIIWGYPTKVFGKHAAEGWREHFDAPEWWVALFEMANVTLRCRAGPNDGNAGLGGGGHIGTSIFHEAAKFDGNDGKAILIRNFCSLCALLRADMRHVRAKFVLSEGFRMCSAYPRVYHPSNY